MTPSVDSASDARTVNNTMRHQYRVLSDAEKANMTTIKDMGLHFHEFIGSLGNSREISLAKTKIEEAVMWAVKHVTGCIVIIVALLCAEPAHAATIEIGQAFGAAVQPYIDAAVQALLFAGLSWLWWVLKSKFKIDIDAGHRDALTAFIQRQASSLIADGLVRLNGTKINVPSDAMARAVNTAGTAIPEVVNHFGLTPEKLSAMIMDALPKQPSVAQAQAIALDVQNPATPSVPAVPAPAPVAKAS